MVIFRVPQPSLYANTNTCTQEKNEGDASKKLPMAFRATMIPRTMYLNGSVNVSRGSFDSRRLYKGAIPKVDGITCMELRRSKKNGGKAVRVEGADRRVADSVTKGISRVCVSDAALYCPDAGNVWLGSAYYHFHWKPRYGTHRDPNFSLTALGLSIISLLSRKLPREKVKERGGGSFPNCNSLWSFFVFYARSARVLIFIATSFVSTEDLSWKICSFLWNTLIKESRRSNKKIKKNAVLIETR